MERIKDIDGRREFFCGTIIRLLPAGMPNVTPEKDYYDYILAYAPWDSKHMMMVNIKGKPGAVYGGVLKITGQGTKTVNKSSFQYTLAEFENWYIVDSSEVEMDI